MKPNAHTRQKWRARMLTVHLKLERLAADIKEFEGPGQRFNSVLEAQYDVYRALRKFERTP